MHIERAGVVSEFFKFIELKLNAKRRILISNVRVNFGSEQTYGLPHWPEIPRFPGHRLFQIGNYCAFYFQVSALSFPSIAQQRRHETGLSAGPR